MRSAAFATGVLQALRERLDSESRAPGGAAPAAEFDCISTVSGGGFAGAWYRSLLANSATGDLDDKRLRQRVAELFEKPYLDASTAEFALLYCGKLLLFWLFAVPALWTVLLVLAALWAGLGAAAGAWVESLAWGAAGAAAIAAGVALVLAQWRPTRRLLTWAGGVLLAAFASHYLVLVLPEVRLAVLLPAAGLPAAAAAVVAGAAHLDRLRRLLKSLGPARAVWIASWVGIGLLVVLAARALAACLPLFEDYCVWHVATFVEGWQLAQRSPAALAPVLRALPVEPLALALPLGLWTLVYGLVMRAKWVSLAEEYARRIREGFNLTADLGELKAPPKLVVNAAASIDEGLHRAWDERKAASFSWDPDGYVDLRFAKTAEQRCQAAPLPGTVKLDRAVATSAAVAGPRMGSYTARPLGLLLGLLNIRLGQWFKLGDELTFEPRGSVLALVLTELFHKRFCGRCDRLHLTDGGHFENLGLYEMVRRGCSDIVVVDASSDPRYRFSDLANAVRKIRRDLEVDIELDGLRWTEDGEVLESPAEGRHQRIYGGTIRYRKERRLGQIVYVKAALLGDEPADVAGYADLHPAFPHESTADQWFSESQFESYRRLGEFTIKSALQTYDAAKQLVLGGGGGDPPPPAVAIVSKLKEAAVIAGDSGLHPTHGGAIVCIPAAHSDVEGRTGYRFLLVESSLGDEWVLPKGHIERGESPLECARRELAEEAGIRWPEGKGQSGAIYERFKRGDGEVRCFYYLLDLWDEAVACRHPCPELTPVPPLGFREDFRVELRRQIWVTPGEYARAVAGHRATAKEDRERLEKEGAGLKGRLKKEGAGLTRVGEELARGEAIRRPSGADQAGPYGKQLANSRRLIPDLVWVLEEAERRFRAARKGSPLEPPAPRDADTGVLPGL